MKIYEIFETQLDCEGYRVCKKRIGLYSSREKAYAFVKNWERTWKNNKIQHKAVYPCWMDTVGKLEIVESEVEQN